MSAIEKKVSGCQGAGESPMPADERSSTNRNSTHAAMKKELTLPASLASIPQLMEFANSFLKERGLLQKVQVKLAMLIDEIVSNIAKFAYGPSGGDVTVQLSADSNGRLVEISFIDEGVAFNPLNTVHADMQTAVANRKIGAQGIFIVKNLADEIEYERKDGKNVLRICVFVVPQSKRSS